MDEIIKQINDTNASYRSPNAGDAKNTDLFLDNEHYELFRDCGEQVTVRFHKENLTKAILFICSILPRKYDQSATHKLIKFSTDFVLQQLAIIDALFTEHGQKVETITQVWNARKDVPKKNGEIDKRFYFNGLLKEISYTDHNGNLIEDKFTIRNYLAGGYSQLHIKKGADGIFDVLVENTTTPHKEESNSQSTYHKYESDSKVTPALQSLLTAIRTKPFILLAGISGTGKSRIVRKLAQATDTIGQYADDAARFACHKPGNFCLIQVKPNWHNSMDVVGYKSNIGKNGEHYEYTDFIDFIAKAWQHPDVPFFLCLDEMNLAPVEEYFAEFLSAIESRSIGANGEYETDPIIKPFKDFGDKVAIEMINHLLGTGYVDTGDFSPLAVRFYLKGMTLPRNLIVMGTVNMDETTFSFSRKVLDRAMSIEMNEVDYDAFLEGSTEMDVPVLVADNQLLIDRAIKAQDVKDNIDAEAVKDFLNSVNNVLEGTPFKLGYRAANEAMLYVSAAKDFGNDNLAAALDEFTLMKILSRIEGGDSKLKTMLGENLLDELQKLFSEGHLGTLTSSKTLAKLNQMIKSLERDHFVSFWG